MNLFGFTVARARDLELQSKALAQLQAVDAWNRGWFRILESEPGAWQRNEEITLDTVLTHPTLFACVALISSDVAKMRLRLVVQDTDGIWTERDNPAWSPVLRKPNHYQEPQQFIQWWLVSKLTNGNTYVLKRRDDRNVVNALYVLDSTRVRPMVAPDASVFYELKTDRVNNLPDNDAGVVYVPAREIIHDRYMPLFHPLVGVSPIYACGLAALQGIRIENNSTTFFGNYSNPSGVLTAPGAISKEVAERIKEHWLTKFSGIENVGKIAVLGDGLKFEPMTAKAVDSQLVEQWESTGKAIATAFRVPYHMVGGPLPNYNNIQALTQQYYGQCLQELVEAIEVLLDKGLELPRPWGTEFDLDDLLMMDTATLIKAEKDANGLKTVNESRRRLNLPRIEGGDTVYRQQQDFSIEALNRRDSQESAPSNLQTALPSADDDDGDDEERAASISAEFRKAMFQ